MSRWLQEQIEIARKELSRFTEKERRCMKPKGLDTRKYVAPCLRAEQPSLNKGNRYEAKNS